MRSKESANDYRYFPDPDLLPLHFEEKLLTELKLPELPFEKSKRFIKDYQLKADTAIALAEDKSLADYFEKIALESKDPQTTSLWFRGELQAQLKERNQKLCPVPVRDFSSLLQKISKGVISNKMAKEIFSEMWDKGLSPEQVIKEKNLQQISGEEDLKKLVIQTLTKYPKQVSDYKAGKNKLFGFFVGQIMKETKGQANPQKLSELLKKELDGS